MAARALPAGAKAPMEPMAIEVGYRVGLESGKTAHTEHASFPLWFGDGIQSGDMVHVQLSDDSVGLEVAYDGETLEVAVTPRCDVRVESCDVTLRHAFATDEQVLLNGYQSWTDTVERPAWSRMRGLKGVSSRLIGRFALDGGGDYAFVDYDGRRGLQHGFTYGTFRRGNGMVLVGSLDEASGFTVIRTDAAHGEVKAGKECPVGTLRAGTCTTLVRLAITRGTAKECYDRWFELSGVRARPVRRLVGYTSWYRHYGDIDERKLASDLAGARSFFARRVPFDMGGVQKLFQIDDGYCKVGDWLAVDAQKFPSGLAAMAAKIRDAGFMPGLWLAPFVCEKDSRLFRERPEWLLRDGEGNPIATGSQWSGGYALDVRNVDVRSYVLEVLQTMTREWGFGLLKVDFLYAACMDAHAGLNRGQLMADAVDLLRKGVKDDTLLLGCGVPLGSAFGKFDYCRIGCDVGLDWDDAPHMRMLHRERVSTKNSLGNTYARAPLDGRAFGNDPDVFFLRKDVRLTPEQRDELLFADADLGSVFLTSDDMGSWNSSMVERYLQALRIACQRSEEPAHAD